MGRNSGGNIEAGYEGKDSNYTGKIENIESLTAIKDPKLYREISAAIGRYHSVLGVRERDVKLAKLDTGVYGVQSTMLGKSNGILLNSVYYKNGSYKDVVDAKRKGYENGFATKTNKPVAHTITHELAHATWNDHLEGANQIAAGKEIKSMFRTWRNDKNKEGYGKYASYNVNEFWAEVSAKAVHGTQDKYTRAVKDIVKKYKL